MGRIASSLVIAVAALAAAPSAWSDEPPQPLELVLDTSLSEADADREDGFVYLKNPRLLMGESDRSAGPGSALANEVMQRAEGGTVDFIYLPGRMDDPRRGLALSLSSKVLRQDLPALAPLDGYGVPVTEPAREVGLSLGYFGFNVAAAVRTDQVFMDGQVDGLEAGLGYRIGNFATTVSVGEYHRDRDDSGYLSSEFDNFYKLELGATYRFNLFSFTGGVQHYDFQRSVLFGNELDGQKLFLRGSVTF